MYLSRGFKKVSERFSKFIVNLGNVLKRSVMQPQKPTFLQRFQHDKFFNFYWQVKINKNSLEPTDSSANVRDNMDVQMCMNLHVHSPAHVLFFSIFIHFFLLYFVTVLIDPSQNLYSLNKFKLKNIIQFVFVPCGYLIETCSTRAS